MLVFKKLKIYFIPCSMLVFKKLKIYFTPCSLTLEFLHLPLQHAIELEKVTSRTLLFYVVNYESNISLNASFARRCRKISWSTYPATIALHCSTTNVHKVRVLTKIARDTASSRKRGPPATGVGAAVGNTRYRRRLTQSIGSFGES